MIYLSREWPQIQEVIQKKRVALFLDFDGTINPMPRRPRDAKLPERVRQLLARLVKNKRVRIAVISGRRIQDLRRQIGISAVYLAGNHALEISGPKMSYVQPRVKRKKNLLTEIEKKLQAAFTVFPQILIENKTYSLSVHYRELPFFFESRAHRILQQILFPYLKKKKILLSEGKKVWEIKPFVLWNKGDAIQKIQKRWGARGKGKYISFYFGDDKSDEDGFRAVGKSGYSVRVGMPGREATAAQYYVRSHEVVILFLEELEKFLNAQHIKP